MHVHYFDRARDTLIADLRLLLLPGHRSFKWGSNNRLRFNREARGLIKAIRWLDVYIRTTRAPEQYPVGFDLVKNLKGWDKGNRRYEVELQRRKEKK